MSRPKKSAKRRKSERLEKNKKKACALPSVCPKANAEAAMKHRKMTSKKS